MVNKERTKLIKMNGIKTTVLVPLKIKPKEIPEEINSEKNHPKGLVLTL